MKKAAALLVVACFVPQAYAQSEVALAAWQRFVHDHGPAWSVQWNRTTGTPHRISGSYLPFEGINQNNVEKVTLAFIAQNRDLLGVDPTQLQLSSAEFDHPGKDVHGRGTWYVAFRQVYYGMPVQGGSVRMVIRSAHVTSIASDFFQGIDLQPQPAVSEQQAVDVVRRDMSADNLFAPGSSRLSIFPDTRTGTLRYFMTWEIVTPVVRTSGRAPLQWRYLVDATSGKILDRTDLFVTANVSGHVNGTARALHQSDSPMIVPMPEINVSLTQGTASQVATDAPGAYAFTGLGTSPATIVAHIAGPHVLVHNDETADPDTTHTATITPPATHDWNFASDDPSPNQVEENVYYHVNRMRQWFLRGTPFDVPPDPDPMNVFVRTAMGAQASAGPGGLFFGSGSAGSDDTGMCADVIYHEFTHRIVARVYENANVQLDVFGQGGAMNEAWADYFACTVTNDPMQGENCGSARNISTPDLRFPDNIQGEVHVDGMIFSGALWDVRSVLGATYVDALALRAMKQAARDFSEYLLAVLDEDDDPSFNSSPAADGNLSNGTPNINTICHSYVDLHGIFDSHCAGHTQQPIAIITSPDPSGKNLLASSATSVAIVGSALGSSLPLQSFVIEYASESAPSTFLSSGVTLAGGGSSAVTSGTLANINTTALANGFYLVRLTVTDTAGATTVVTTNIIIDHSQMSGWPQSTNVSFHHAPAVGDIDPAFPGLEVVAHGSDGMLRVWHRDGTSVAGFPIYAGDPTGSPALADVDGDGVLDIIAVDSGTGRVHVFRSNGTELTGWPQTCPTWIYASTPAVGDIDGDGKPEIVIGSMGSRVCAWHGNGVAVSGWPVSTGGDVRNAPAIADLLGDGKREVIAGSFDGNLYAWRGDGTPLPGWPVTIGHQVSASPAVADVDGDGHPEIVAGEWDDTNILSSRVHVLHYTGIEAAGWPRTVNNSFSVPCSGVVADFDGDGVPDVIVQLYDNSIYAWRGDATPISPWPRLGFGGYEFFPSGAPVIADIDGDGQPDILWEGNGVNFGFTSTFVNHVHAVHLNGTPLAGWPRVINTDGSAPTLADVDGDGNIDVIVGADGIFIWKLNTPFAPRSTDWVAYRHDQQRSGALRSISPMQQPQIDLTSGETLAIGGASQQKLAQTVTADRNGNWISVALPVACSAGSDLTLNIEGVGSDGKPNGTVLRSQIIPASSLPAFVPPYFQSMAFTTPLPVTQGDRFAIVLTVPSGSCGMMQGPAGDSYRDGNAYFDSRPNAAGVWLCECDFAGGRFDLPFTTVVQP